MLIQTIVRQPPQQDPLTAPARRIRPVRRRSRVQRLENKLYNLKWQFISWIGMMACVLALSWSGTGSGCIEEDVLAGFLGRQQAVYDLDGRPMRWM